jgi:hypothetical protein
MEQEIDWSQYLDRRLSPEQIENSSTLIEDDDLKEEIMEILHDCQIYWDNLRPVRDASVRATKYYIGDQWSDYIVDPDSKNGGLITEGEHIKRQGKVPLKQNQIRQVIKHLLGQFRDNDNTSTVISRQREKQKVGEMLSNALSSVLAINRTKELDVRQFEKFLLSGVFGWKTSYGWHSNINVDDIIIDPVYDYRLFFNTGITDIRKKEIHTVGEVLDVPIDDIISTFAKNEADEEKIREWYGISGNKRRNPYASTTASQNSTMVENIDFWFSDDLSKCRVFEVWKQKLEKVVIVHDHMTGQVYEAEESIEDIEAENENRIKSATMFGVPMENIPLLSYEERMEKIWYFWFVTPWGNILQHGRTPYDHEQTPYTLGLFPLVDGNIFGLVQDIIDQQRQINRLLTLLDFIMGSSAKGVLMFPEDMKPEGLTEDEIADEWVRFNGVIFYKPSTKHNHMPQQISTNSTNIGLVEQLQIQFNLLKEISGVTDAIQGHRPTAGTPSSLYAQQTHNASLSNRDFFEFFFSIKKERDFKIVKNIQQFYDDERFINISGKDYNEDVDYYRPELAKEAEFNMTMGQSTTSNAYRQIIDEWLGKFLDAGHIDFNTFLDNTSMPFADKLKESVMRVQDQLSELQAQGQQGDPQAMQMIEQMMKQQSNN